MKRIENRAAFATNLPPLSPLPSPLSPPFSFPMRFPFDFVSKRANKVQEAVESPGLRLRTRIPRTNFQGHVLGYGTSQYLELSIPFLLLVSMQGSDAAMVPGKGPENPFRAKRPAANPEVMTSILFSFLASSSISQAPKCRSHASRFFQRRTLSIVPFFLGFSFPLFLLYYSLHQTKANDVTWNAIPLYYLPKIAYYLPIFHDP